MSIEKSITQMLPEYASYPLVFPLLAQSGLSGGKNI
jgi:hypothetical protein